MSYQTQLSIVPASPMFGIEPDGFYQTPNSMATKAIRAKLTAADWALWSYLQMIDPFGDRMVELPKVSEIAEAIGVSERQVKRSLSKLEDLELYRWEPVVIRGQNLAGKQAKELCQKKKASQSTSRTNKYSHQRKMTNLSKPGQNCPEDDKFVQTRTELSNLGQNCPNQELEPSPNKNSSTPQTIQTYSDFIQTLSEEERANFLEFCEEKTKNLTQEVNDIEAWLAHTNKAGKNRWQVYHEKYLASKQVRTKKTVAKSALDEFRRELEEKQQQAQRAWEESQSQKSSGGAM